MAKINLRFQESQIEISAKVENGYAVHKKLMSICTYSGLPDQLFWNPSVKCIIHACSGSVFFELFSPYKGELDYYLGACTNMRIDDKCISEMSFDELLACWLEVGQRIAKVTLAAHELERQTCAKLYGEMTKSSDYQKALREKNEARRMTWEPETEQRLRINKIRNIFVS